MAEDIVNEDLDICRECGGRCCIKCGCDYGASDFSDHSYKALLKELSEGDKSIVAVINFRTLPSGKFIAEPFLYLRARNVDRDVVDLVSMKTRCSQLADNGCGHDYSHRPLGGRNLIPSRKGMGTCKPEINPVEIVGSWEPYQKVLRRIVKQYTGVSVETKVKEDVENLFCDVLSNNYKGVSRAEMEELDQFIPLLVRAFPEERHKANVRCRGTGLKVFNKK